MPHLLLPKTAPVQSLSRRGWLKFGGSGLLAAMALSACGGGSSDPDSETPQDIEEPDVVLAEGVSDLRTLPEAEPIDMAIAMTDTSETIVVNVLLGDAPQANATVHVYDVQGNLLTQGITDDTGTFHSDVLAKRVLFAHAQVPAGNLYGYCYAHDGILFPTLNVNVYQTLAAHLAERLEMDYNIINFLLQRQFTVGFNEEIQSIGVDNPYFSPAKFVSVQLASGLTLNAFMAEMANAIVTQMDHFTTADLRFQPDPAVLRARFNAMQVRKDAQLGIDDNTKYKVLEFALNQAEKLLNSYIRFPYSPQVFKFFFDKIKGHYKPEAPDPLAEVKQKLAEISTKLDEMQDYMEQKEIRDRWREMKEVWALYAAGRNNFNTAQTPEAIKVAIDTVYTAFTNHELKILSLNDWFFGSDLVGKDAFLSVYSEYVNKNVYYSADVQEKVDDYISHFLLHQTEMIGFITAMIICKFMQEDRPEAEAKAAYDSLERSLQETRRLVDLYKSKKPPIKTIRLLVHKPSKTMWVGMCGTVERLHDWMPPYLHTQQWRFCCSPTTKWPGEGVAPNGIDNNKYMLQPLVNPNVVSKDVLELATWVVPKYRVLENVFTNPLKKSKLDFAAYSEKHGIPQEFASRTWDPSTKKLESSFAVIATSSFIDDHSAAGLCWYSKTVSLKDGSTHEVAFKKKYYDDHKKYGYFPQGNLSSVTAYELTHIYQEFYKAAFPSS